MAGGGINGSAIARAAALAGRRVLLVERGDLAQATSSASTKLIHGGLRYLETRDFALVRESLAERRIMLRTAPHLVRPLEFRMPHDPAMRPWWMLRAGLLLYDLFATGGGLPRSRGIRIDDPALAIRGGGRGRGFSYWDATVDDARLVVLNARDAADLGADIRTRTRLVAARLEGEMWAAELDGPAGRASVRAAMLVNAAGPWVAALAKDAIGDGAIGDGEIGVGVPPAVRLVRGSHIVLGRRLGGDHAWLLQQPDGRIVFAIPWLDAHTLIGTTDMPVASPDAAEASAAEVDYLITAANRWLARPIGRSDIVATFAGIRALADDSPGARAASKVSRDYRLDLNRDGAPLLNVVGGKITTARALADAALKRLEIGGGDTSDRPLPGGDFIDRAALERQSAARWPFLDTAMLTRLVAAYGTRIDQVLGDAASLADLGAHFGAGLYAREVDYLMAREWAWSAEDVLIRRTKLGYALHRAAADAVQLHMRGMRA